MSIRYKTPEYRIPLRRKPVECCYPKCKKEATHTLGMADPDAERIPYCKKHCDIVKMNTIIELHGKEAKDEEKDKQKGTDGGNNER